MYISTDSISISDMMSKDVKVEAQNQNIFAVAKIMSDNDIGSVIIIDNHENRNPVGIVTKRDILRILDIKNLIYCRHLSKNLAIL